MNQDLSQIYLNSQYPHILNTIAPTSLATFSCHDQIAYPAHIDKNVALLLPTSNNSPLRLQTCYELDIFPFVLEEICEDQLIFENKSASLHWSPDRNLVLHILNNDIELLNQFIENNLYLINHHEKIPLYASIKSCFSRENHFDILHDFCNLTSFMLQLDLTPIIDIRLTAKRFSIATDKKNFKFSDSPKISINSILCENRFTMQSDPFCIDKQTVAYEILPHNTFCESPVLPLSSVTTCYFTPDHIIRDHGKIISVPLECYQGLSYQSITSLDAVLSEDSADNINHIKIFDAFTKPLPPNDHSNIISAVSMLSFDYLSQDHQDKHKPMLIDLIRAHTRIKNSILDEIIELILTVTLEKSDDYQFAYFITFSNSHPYLYLFIAALSDFFIYHKPVNFDIWIDYEIM